MPRCFSGVRVLEVGSLNIYGSVRTHFDGCEYLGVDLAEGEGVDWVCPGQLLAFPAGHFDTVVSSECFEHNPFWRETFANMLRMCRPGGLVLMTCATVGRKEHGTSRTSPHASPFTADARWDYYRNLSERDLRSAIHLSGWMSQWRFWTNFVSHDLYFAGFRQGGDQALGDALMHELDRRYALTSSAKSLRRALKAQILRQ